MKIMFNFKKTLAPAISLGLFWYLYATNYMHDIIFELNLLRRLHQVTRLTRDDPANTPGHWINHLCPRYRLRKHTKFMKLTFEPPDEDTIFLIQTSCGLPFTGKQACAVESAALHHQYKRILVLITAPSIDDAQPLIKILLKLPNVHFSSLDLDDVFFQTPLQTWHSERDWLIREDRASAFISDAVRTVLILKYGGTYIDMDALTLRPFPNITNYLGRLDSLMISGAIMNFARDHPFLRIMLNAMPMDFDSSRYDSIGPKLVLSSAKQFCPGNISAHPVTMGLRDASDVEEAQENLKDVSPYLEKPEMCGDITIFPDNMLYPFHYSHYTKETLLPFISEEGYGKKFFKWTKAYSLHLYSSFERKIHIVAGRDSILEDAMKRNCPKVCRYLKNSLDIL